MSPPSSQVSPTVAALLRAKLKETGRSTAELAEAVQIPTAYIDDLLAGRRRPPLPGRTDVYDKMTSFLGFARNELAECAQTERDAAAPAKVPSPKPTVRRQLLMLCEPAAAEKLGGRSARAELATYVDRLLGITQTAVQRMLQDKTKLRAAATASAESYAAMRLRVLDFLDATADTLTTEHVERFVLPRVARWDVDEETGALRVVMRAERMGPTAVRSVRARSL